VISFHLETGVILALKLKSDLTSPLTPSFFFYGHDL